jgi:hypothetical protein
MSATNPIVRALQKKFARRRIGAWRLILDQVRPFLQRVGWFHISVALASGNGRRIGGPAMTAIVSGGGRGVKPWIEGRLYPTIKIGSETIRTRAAGIQDELIAIMGEVIPLGGHLMIDYESGGQEQTFSELRAGIPPAATSLGARMLVVGFVGEFKDWYFSEGGHEGLRKLQANKPPDALAARRAIAQRIEELEVCRKRLNDTNHSDTMAGLIQRTRILIEHLEKRRPAHRTLEALRAGEVSRENRARPARSARARGRRRRPVPSR